MRPLWSSRRARVCPVAFWYGALRPSLRQQDSSSLDDARGAADAAGRALKLIDPSFVRDRAMYTLYLSSAYMQIKEIDQAASALAEAAELAVRNRSARLTDRLLETRAGASAVGHDPSCS
jgi:hypothetical protein